MVISSTDRIHVIREATKQVVRILADKDINVTQRGTQAFVEHDRDGKINRINIPYIPDNASEELINAIQGFMDHEVGHVLFSDLSLLAKSKRSGFGQEHNIVEDTFVETKMERRFRGSGWNLDNVRHFFMDKFSAPKLEEMLKDGADEANIFRILVAPAFRAWAGQQVAIDFMEDKWQHIENFCNVIGKDLQDRVPQCQSTQDCYDLAKEVKDRLKKAAEEQKERREEEERKKEEERQKEEEQEQGDPGDDDSGDSGDSPEEGDDDEEGSGDSGDEEGDEEGDDEESDNEPGGEEGDDDEDDEDDGDSPSDGGDDDSGEDDSGSGDDEPDEGGDDEPEGSGDSGDAGESDDDEDDPEGSESGSASEDEDEGDEGEDEADNDKADSSDSDSDSDGDAVDNKLEEDIEMDGDDFVGGDADFEEYGKRDPEDFDDSVAIMISDATQETAESSDYNIYTEEEDKIEVWNPRDAGFARTSAMEDRVDHMIGLVQKEMERMIVARSRSRWIPGMTRGKIDNRVLGKLAIGHQHRELMDDRIFRQKEEHTSKDIAVQLVIDCSGSMDGSKITTACHTAYALASVLERLHIPHEVIGFTTGQFSHSMQRELNDELKKGVNISRWEALNMPIFKTFSERFNPRVKSRFAEYPSQGVLWNNIDGESIEICARRLIQRPESGKMMIVLSDGNPIGNGETGAIRRHAKDVIRRIEDSKIIDIIGIGIMTKSVSQYYQHHVVLNGTEDLPRVVMNELKTVIMRNIH